MKAVVVAAGELTPPDADHIARSDLLVAADGGAAALTRLGHRPALVVGDMDSLDGDVAARLAQSATRLVRVSAEKDETDMELAVDAAIDAGADRVTLLGALGGVRPDHALANLLLLGDEALAGRSIRLSHGNVCVRAVHGGERALLEAGVGDIVSLLPIGGDAEGVFTDGLRYPLRAERLRFGRARGVSNEVISTPAAVSLASGSLLVFEIAAGSPHDKEVIDGA